ncbi:DNA-binding NarL/FixJ family response regulator [Paractinoplanes brasiliensis]|uniref:DNA-binding NarL/FixJ family response regulator n=1 Tax=Paractinoplanes brasiliensis TaxID=52695 RepID=A0A4V3C6B6_9ACTN|nr:response regulator transcription factor [Actinoplanes brasiliensis]MDY7085807.1 response regulator transcription factor [Actinomycetota bacterium]TDO33078.1 DNA-binding NarL/FixJ family response regulator [Actinoplanes brasiliensis]
MERVRVVLQASDPLSQAGLTALLQSAPEISLLRPAERNDAHVLVFAYEQVSAEVVTVLRRTALETGLPVVLVVNAITESELLVAIENRVVAILPRGAVSAERLVHSVTTAAAGGGVLPPNMVGELLKHIERLQREVLAPNGLNASGLTPREVDVLRLMADGKDTQEIAGELCYSERTVKNVIHNLTHRLKLRNRSHAVAYALRAGMI